MSMNLYVGNLPYSTTESELETLFGEYGEIVTVKVITNRETGRSRGFGFVEMSNREDGEKAIEGLHEKMIENRALIVNEARSRKNDRRPKRNHNSNRNYNS